MARRRFIDPRFWIDPHIAKLSREQRLFFLGCMSAADDEGRLLGSAAFLRAQIFPYDEDLTVDDVRTIRDHVLEAEKNLVLYEVDGVKYMAFLKWSRYQKPSHPTPSTLPPPPSGNVPESLQNSSRNAPSQVGLGKVGLGRGSIGAPTAGKSPEREKTISMYVRLYTPSPPGVDVPYSEYPSEGVLDDLELECEIWGDKWVQKAIRRARELGRTKVGPLYLRSILVGWKDEGKLKPKITEEEFERLREEKERPLGKTD